MMASSNKKPIMGFVLSVIATLLARSAIDAQQVTMVGFLATKTCSNARDAAAAQDTPFVELWGPAGSVELEVGRTGGGATFTKTVTKTISGFETFALNKTDLVAAGYMKATFPAATTTQNVVSPYRNGISDIAIERRRSLNSKIKKSTLSDLPRFGTGEAMAFYRPKQIKEEVVVATSTPNSGKGALDYTPSNVHTLCWGQGKPPAIPDDFCSAAADGGLTLTVDSVVELDPMTDRLAYTVDLSTETCVVNGPKTARGSAQGLGPSNIGALVGLSVLTLVLSSS